MRTSLPSTAIAIVACLIILYPANEVSGYVNMAPKTAAKVMSSPQRAKEGKSRTNGLPISPELTKVQNDGTLSVGKTILSSSGKATTRSNPTFFQKLLRRVQVYWLAFRVFADYKLAQRSEKRLRQRMGLSLDEDADVHPAILALWDTVHERNAIRVTNAIKRLSGFWVKVGQYLSSRADVMPPVYLTHLSTLQDSLPAKPFSDICMTLSEELTPEKLELFEQIDPEPISTASLAQVHRASLKDTKRHDVVIKVQHRGVASLMIQDMENLRLILQMIAHFEPDFDFRPVIREYNHEVRKELDFRTEAENMKEVRELLAACNVRAIVPETVPSLVTERVLVMDYCHGFSVRDVEKLDENNVNRELLLRRICAAWAAQMHVGGVFNADPHPGNILVLAKDNAGGDTSVPVLLDFGLTKRLEPEMKLAFSRLMHASDETDIDSLLQSFEEMGLKLNRHDPFEDMAAMQRGFGDTIPQDQVKEASKEKRANYKRRQEAIREDMNLPEGKKLRSPVDAWPAELIFFGRVTNMLRGLCSRLNVRYPYLATMGHAARTTIKNSVPEAERAKGPIHPSVDEINTPLQRRLADAVQKLENDGHMLGLQICVRKDGEELANISSGVLGTANPRPVTPSTLFCMFSVSKAVLTLAVLRLLQEGEIRLDDPIALHWPKFGANGKGEITVRHILSHQAGLANAMPEGATIDLLLDWSEMKRSIENAKPEHAPGEKTQYHYLTYAWICGGLIEAVTGEPYEQFLTDMITKPLGLSQNLYMGGISSEVKSHKLAVLAVDRQGRERRVSASDSNSESVKKEGKQILAKYRGSEHLLNPSIFNMRRVREAKLPSASGHASATALATIFDSLVRSKVEEEQESSILSSPILEEARVRQHPTSPKFSAMSEGLLLDDSSASFGLGLQIHDFQMPGGETVRSLGHAGLGGSVVVTIPEMKLTVAFMTNLLSFNNTARGTLLSIVFDEFELKPPQSFNL